MDESKMLIEVLPDSSISGRKTYTTGFSSSVGQMLEIDSELFEKIKCRIEKFGRIFYHKILADEAALEFPFGITGNGNICILSSSSSIGMKVTLKWKKKEGIENS